MGPDLAALDLQVKNKAGDWITVLPCFSRCFSACWELGSAAARVVAVPSMHPLCQLLLHCFFFNPSRPTIRILLWLPHR